MIVVLGKKTHEDLNRFIIHGIENYYVCVQTVNIIQIQFGSIKI